MQHDNAPDTTRKYTRNSCFSIARRLPSEISSRHQFKYTMYFLISERLKVKNILIYTWFTCKQYIGMRIAKCLRDQGQKGHFKKGVGTVIRLVELYVLTFLFIKYNIYIAL